MIERYCQIFNVGTFSAFLYGKRAFCLGCICTFALSCSAQKNLQATGTLRGITGEYSGNCMPSPGMEPCKPAPISTTVFITSSAEQFDPSNLIAEVTSDASGRFEVSLKPGKYSLFLKDAEEVVCDSWECPGECYCSPIEIIAGQITQIQLNLDHATW